jgi:D-alanyl-lipoteichoic acid acyltransferase DltB (MBOAT superfamily)
MSQECIHNDCKLPGTMECSREYGKVYEGKDGNAYWCEKHFLIAFNLYKRSHKILNFYLVMFSFIRFKDTEKKVLAADHQRTWGDARQLGLCLEWRASFQALCAEKLTTVM